MSKNLTPFYIELCKRVLGCADALQYENAHNLLRLAMICDDNRAPEPIADAACEMDFAFKDYHITTGVYDHDQFCAALDTLKAWVDAQATQS